MKASTTTALSLGLLFLASASTAYAWEHIGVVFTPEYLPLTVYTADDDTTNTIARCEATGGLSGCCEETVPQGYCLEAVELGFEGWLDAPCADVQYQVVDTHANPELAAPNIVSFNRTDFYSHSVYNDPSEDLEVGVIAASSGQDDATASVVVGDGLYRIRRSADIAWNDNVSFVTNEQVENGECVSGQQPMVPTAVHELGHHYGLAHSCEDPQKGGGPCTERVLLEATMYWQAEESSCSLNRAVINSDDIESITALYGPSASFNCSRQVADGLSVGKVPFDINCAVVSPFLKEVTGATWLWGDGSPIEDGLTATHRYTEAGNYTVEVSVQGEREACGPEGWSNRFRRVGYVRACDVPDPSFEVEQLKGLRYRFLNDSDVSVFGCISEIQWDIFKGDSPDGERVGEPIAAWEPELEFPEPGTYHVVLSLGGIGGTGGAAATFDVDRTGGTQAGCSTSGLPAGGAALGLLLAGLLVRRRR